jgi:hypothetical protein
MWKVVGWSGLQFPQEIQGHFHTKNVYWNHTKIIFVWRVKNNETLEVWNYFALKLSSWSLLGQLVVLHAYPEFLNFFQNSRVKKMLDEILVLNVFWDSGILEPIFLRSLDETIQNNSKFRLISKLLPRLVWYFWYFKKWQKGIFIHYFRFSAFTQTNRLLAFFKKFENFQNFSVPMTADVFARRALSINKEKPLGKCLAGKGRRIPKDLIFSSFLHRFLYLISIFWWDKTWKLPLNLFHGTKTK